MMGRLLLLAFLLPVLALGQKQKIEDHTLISNRTPDGFYKTTPRVLKWLEGDKVVLTKPFSDFQGAENTVYNLKQNKEEEFSEDMLSSTIEPKMKVAEKDGDLYLISGSGEFRLTFDPEAIEKNPGFSPDSSYIAYSKNNDLYIYDIASKKESRITHDGNQTVLNGFATWVYWEEIFGRSTGFRAYWWSPDSKHLAFMRFDETNTPMFPIYSSEGQYGYIEETRYPKAGSPNPTAQIGFVGLSDLSISWADFDTNQDHYFGWPKWSLDSKDLMVQWINRGNDHLKIFKVAPKSGDKSLVYEETQKEWINIDEADERLTLLDNGREMVIISDKTGWKQLYLYTVDGQLKNKITDGKFTVTRVFGIDQKERVIYFHARGLESSDRFDVYSVSFDGKNLKRLTFGNYNHNRVSFSPDFKYFATTYSNLITPYQTVILNNQGEIVLDLGSTKGNAFDGYELSLPQRVYVKSDDGKFNLPLNITYPENMVEGRKYPLMINIYGGPDAGTVYNQWSWSSKSQWWAREGLIQVTMDHRASGHFGKEGVAYMHRNLSKYEMDDYVSMVRYLIKQGFVDESKVFITGFSYGGYITSMALTRHSDVFTHGIAGGSVTDWSLYDTAYTERFMDTPQENPEGYQHGNVMNFVDQYKGKLMIVHGTMDDNVHLQNSIQLIEALQKKNKDFEMMFYPGGRHGWGGAQGVHFSNLQTSFVYKYLLEKPVPEGLLIKL